MADRKTEFFSNAANCYAHAVKRTQPTNGGGLRQAIPGGELPGDNYYTRLSDAVGTDGGASVKSLGRFAVASLTTAQIPVPSANHYLIGMLVKEVGFHFIRREIKHFAGRRSWKWKQGNLGVVELNAYSAKSKSYVRVTNLNLPDLIKGNLRTDPPGYVGWEWIYFFEVASGGFDVTAY